MTANQQQGPRRYQWQQWRRGPAPWCVAMSAVILHVVAGCQHKSEPLKPQLEAVPSANTKLAEALSQKQPPLAEDIRVEKIKACLAKGASPYAPVRRLPALHYAAMFRAPSSVKALLATGADVNAVTQDVMPDTTRLNMTPLMCAVEEVRLDNVRFLLSQGADPKQKPGKLDAETLAKDMLAWLQEEKTPRAKSEAVVMQQILAELRQKSSGRVTGT